MRGTCNCGHDDTMLVYDYDHYAREAVTMTFNDGEYGSILRVNLGVDISAGTSLTVVLEPERGDKKSFTSNVALGSSNVDVDDEEFLADEHLEYTLQDGDLDQVGPWRARGSAIVSGELIKGDFVRFTVLP